MIKRELYGTQYYMPITKSAKKALRQSIKRRAANLKVRTLMRKLEKEVRIFALQKKISEAKNLLPQLSKALDKAAKVGVIKKNTASRRKSRVAKLVAKGAQ